jgi:hypothetical protein
LQLINQLAGKCKVVPVPKHHAVKSNRVRADTRHAFPTTALVHSEWSAPRSNRLTQGKRPLVPIRYEAWWATARVWAM